MRTGWIVAGFVGALAAGAVWLAVTRGGPRGEDGAATGSAGTVASAAGARHVAGPPDEVAAASDAPVDWRWSAAVDSGGGRVGPWRMNESDWRYVDDPTVALDAGGETAVAWVDQRRRAVLFRRYGPGGEPVVDEPVDVSRSPDVFSWLPRVVVPPDDPDRVYVLWQEIVFSGGTHGGEAFFARSTDGGRTFGDPLNLSETRAGAGKGRLSPRRWQNGSLDLALGPDGAVHAAWTVYEGGLFTVRSDDGGRSFSEPVRVSRGEGAEPARGPALAAGPGDTVRLVWAVGEDLAADLRAARSTDGGRTWGEPRALLEGAGRADAPALAVDGEGTLHLAWAEGPAGRDGGGRVLYARAPAGAGFGVPRTVGDPDAGPGDVPLERVGFPTLALDGDGDPWLAWELYPVGAGRSRGLGLAASDDGGESFGPATLVPGTVDPAFSVNGSLQGLLMRKLAVNGAGDVAVVNSSFESGVASRVRLVRGRAASR